ncbi:MAG TPA: HAMP domain-containing sensor histidine kinase [Frankiaceae bacterium]|nr:HAMP domain-containing sensor histidine kinase [Frankiaceae bacterium]
MIVLDSAHELDEGTVGAVLLVAALVGVASVVAVGLALVQARRLAAPMVGLAQAADRLGRGRFDLPRGGFGLPEADHVAEVLADSAARVGELVRRQAQFASDAAHQLRTPLTAIGLRLEEMVAASDQEEVRAEGRLALAQADRLARVVTALLARARGGTGEPPRSVQAAALLREQEQQWAPVYARAGRTLVVDGADGTVWASPSHVGQAVGVLLDNALRHGGGTVRLAAREEGRRVRLSVSDEGPGIPDELVPRLFDRAVSGAEGTGIGLALARALVEADRGQLELARARPPLFAVVLPAAPNHSLTGS